jgi:endonuclease/exonuclease/phosphatase family metal-dependent hydrolase
MISTGGGRAFGYQLQSVKHPKPVGTLTPALACLILALILGAHPLSADTAVSKPSPPSRTLRVMTYNIHVGVGMDKKLDLQRIADVINRQHPDLVGLQEVDRGVQRTQRIDEIAEIAKLTRMDYAFAFNLAYQGGQYGVAILSRMPIMSTDHRLFKNLREAERRGFIRAEVSFHGRTLNFVTTHLDYQFDDGRLFEVQQLIDALKETKDPLIIVGDFNDIPSGRFYQLMREYFVDAWMDSGDIGGANSGFSFPADKPVKRIDYVFFRPDGGVKTKRSWVVNTLASDHIPVVADLEVR